MITFYKWCCKTVKLSFDDFSSTLMTPTPINVISLFKFARKSIFQLFTSEQNHVISINHFALLKKCFYSLKAETSVEVSFTFRRSIESVSICWYWNLYWHYNFVSPNVVVIWAAEAIKCYVLLKGFWSCITILSISLEFYYTFSIFDIYIKRLIYKNVLYWTY